MLWVDKYRPKSLRQLSYHDKLSARLANLGGSQNITHMLFYGPDGAGKKTRVMALLREMYGPNVNKVKLEFIQFKNRSGKNLEITAAASSYHTEINASDVGNNDHYAVKVVIKNMAQTKSLGVRAMFAAAASSASSSSSSSASSSSSSAAGGGGAASVATPTKRQFRVLVLTAADKLTKGAQQALRRIMEKYAAHCRLILLCNSTSKIIEAVRSRCLCIRVAAPTHAEIADVLSYVARRENLTAPADLLLRIAEQSGRNLRRAVLMFEACKAQQYPFKAGQEIRAADWEVFLAELARSILNQQSPAVLKSARNALYQLLTNCIPGPTILRVLTKELLRKCKPAARAPIIRTANWADLRLQQGSKDIFHLEAFVARFMLIYKKLGSHVEW